MARIRLLDYMQNYPFWLFDIPTLGSPLMSLVPITGFQSITAPELTIETTQINQGNNYFPKYKVQRAACSPLTLVRGAQFWDADYWRWIGRAVTGDGPYIKRDLMLLHFTGYSMNNLPEGPLGVLLAGFGIATMGLAFPGMSLGAGLGIGGIDTVRIPGRAWKLFNCLPIRYKAASDFDATSGDVSLMELDIQPEYFEEIGLSA